MFSCPRRTSWNVHQAPDTPPSKPGYFSHQEASMITWMFPGPCHHEDVEPEGAGSGAGLPRTGPELYCLISAVLRHLAAGTFPQGGTSGVCP